jgi:ribonuclease I
MTLLRWLDFDYSEGTDDTGVFDAMASVAPAHAAAVEAEILQVLAWAEAHFAGLRGPVEEAGAWDADLQVVQEQDRGGLRHSYSFTLSGSPAFCEAFRAQFGQSVLPPTED